jgi:hypothetical protein
VNAADQARDVAVDAQGNVYVAGGSEDRGFPTTANAYQRTFGQGKPATSTGSDGNWDVFVMKFSPGGQLVWPTLIGGGNYDRAYAVEVDDSGVYIAGRAGEGFPTTAGVVQPAFAGDNVGSSTYGRQDGFIAKLSLDGGTLLWSTYFGGGADEFIRDLAVGANGDVYPAMATVKAGFPHITSGTHRGQGDGAACRLSADARTVRWCAYIGGSGQDGASPSVRLDGAGNVYYLQATSSTNVTTTAGAYRTTAGGGVDMHISKFSPQGTLLFATYFGGSGNDGTETHNLWVTPAGDVYVAAFTTSTNLPTTAGAFQPRLGGAGDGFIARLSSDGRQVVACTYLGGTAGDEVEGITVDGDGNVIVTGSTAGQWIARPSVPAAGGGLDGFIAVLTPNLTSVIDFTLVGGSGRDAGRAIAVDVQQHITYVIGHTFSSNLPTTASAYSPQYGGTDSFLAGWRYQ